MKLMLLLGIELVCNNITVIVNTWITPLTISKLLQVEQMNGGSFRTGNINFS